MVVSAATAGPDLVGRERELDILGGLLDRAWAEEAHSVVVSGDSGVGKTALVARACADHRGGEALIGTCLPLTSMSIPFLPIRSALRANPHLVAPPEAPVDGGEREFALRFDAWLDEQTARTPVVLVVDDVQWADRSTLDTLMYAIAGSPSRRLAIVMTLRAGEIGLGHPLQRWLADVRRMPRTFEMELAPLDREATAAQIEILLGGSPHQSLIDDVYSRSRGNPYFTRLLVAGLPPEARGVPAAFPSDLSSAVLQSWYRLSEPTRELASVLAVGGRAMSADELARIVANGGGSEDVRASLREAVDSGTLDRLEDGTVWFHHPLNAEVLEATLGEDERQGWHRRFADDLAAAASGTSLAVGSAVSLADHRYRAGQDHEAFEAALAAADAAGAVAGHAEQIRLLRRAAELRIELLGAGRSLESILRSIRAVAAEAGQTEDELWAVERLLATVDPTAAPLVASELLVRRMHLRFMAGLGFIDVREMQEAVRLAEADRSSPEYSLALAELAHAELWAGLPDAGEHAETAIAVARRTADPRALALALAAGSMAASFAGDLSSAAELGTEALAPALRARAWWEYVHASMWAANAVETWASEAYASMMRDRALALVQHGGPHPYVAWLATSEALSRLTSGSPDEAEMRLRIALGSDPGPLGDVEARLAAARLAVLQGRQREAEDHLRRVEELIVDGSTFRNLEYDAVRAEVRLGAGDAAGAYDAALAGAADRGSPPTMAEWLLPFAARALADRAQAARDVGESDRAALASLDALVERFPHVIEDVGSWTELMRRQNTALDAVYAAECARARGSAGAAEAWVLAAHRCHAARLPWEEAYARWRAAEALLVRGGDRLAGADMLRLGLVLARHLGARPVVDELLDLAQRARIPIEESRPVRVAADTNLPSLTEREREVLALVAVGRTYSEIARELMISDKTVSTHVSHLLAKTGSANRVELARLVHRVGADGNRGGE
ncbi:DNA-binding CsgD family transcriptional regulator [Agromyces flavus]|uniref:DNA-binding CsgD family transcriptional regulator n=1 Tax=Agromyces flavus TaxID=589382 RepID=A0A1H1R4K7_9MICO|nr:AAA family ATPase [Agromyces flavus]MCP2367624.1 DNA-binding CsgD family transcriptional regulator [Agromyces flavus]GGI47069.1 hypothetical protein GCM10010932_17710 [Agromyces flavus]SDS30446.1 regulatory protein, luxR family [Agromyces flavus]